MKHEVIETEKASFPVSLMCRCLEISRSGFYAARQRPVSRRTRENELMTQRIQSCYTRSRETYGSPRIYHDLREEGWAVGRHRVARLMKASGLRAIPPRRWRGTTDSKHSLPVAENVLARDFEVTDLNRVWAGDITYIWTWEGWLYLAVILDLASRRAIGWSMADHLRTELPLGALDMALGQREVPSHLLHHSDRGSQYASRSYQERLREHGIQCSMSRQGDCWDNAVVESFFGTLKTELIHRRRWRSRREARSAIFEYIEVFYNRHRRHSSLAYQSPVAFEESLVNKSAPASLIA